MNIPALPRVLLIITISASLLAPASGVTADQLARYLGVSSMSTTVWLPPKTYVVEIYEIKDGKIDRRLIKSDPDWITTKEGPLTIMLGPDGEKQKIVFCVGESMTVTAHTDVSTMGGTVRPPLPEFIKAPGDFIFLGRGDLKKNRNLQDPKSFESGLLLRVSSVSK